MPTIEIRKTQTGTREIPVSDLIRQKTLAKIDAENLSVVAALNEGLNPLVVLERARTLQEHLEIAAALVDPFKTQGLHPKVRQGKLDLGSLDEPVAKIVGTVTQGLIGDRVEIERAEGRDPKDIEGQLLMFLESALIPS